MCFSASASFISCVALVVVGAALWKRGFKEEYRFLALMPFIFASLQFCEGYIWLKGEEAPLFIFVYLATALCFWPIWVPAMVLKIEKQQKTRNFDFIFLGIGIAVAIVYSSLIPFFEINRCVDSIHYVPTGVLNDLNIFVMGITYLAAVTFPFLLSSNNRLKLLGLFFLAGAFFSYYTNVYWYISLWCFLSACLSLFLFWVIPSKKNS